MLSPKHDPGKEPSHAEQPNSEEGDEQRTNYESNFGGPHGHPSAPVQDSRNEDRGDAHRTARRG
ncbi:hypothetical protein BG842_19405 [Haladaptatus sp. W1]|uniref:hypothetical protein n=1 Tax=Haladaptatus sp. W1 TaxID=1897478 RepID=UPI00084984B5|nr:hypothetical protein [Haladaptatus sp. W1]ODR81673.1 hypothetical protein BG842_19405 [Haladaptatus sp. W1]